MKHLLFNKNINLVFDFLSVGYRDEISQQRKRGRVSAWYSQCGSSRFETRFNSCLDLPFNCSELNSSTMLVNSQMVCLLPFGVLKNTHSTPSYTGYILIFVNI